MTNKAVDVWKHRCKAIGNEEWNSFVEVCAQCGMRKPSQHKHSNYPVMDTVTAFTGLQTLETSGSIGK